MVGPNGGHVTGTPLEGGPESYATVDKDSRTWGMIAHLSAFAAVVLPTFGNVVGPLVVWLIKKDEMPFVDDQAKEALNFNITLVLAGLVAGALTLVLIGFVLLGAIAVYGIVMTIIAATRAHKGEAYRYPLTLRLIK